MNVRAPTTDADSDSACRHFDDELHALDALEAPQPPSAIAALMARFNAAMHHPETQSIGDFAQMLHGIGAELSLMAHAQGFAAPNQDAAADWAAILAAADGMPDGVVDDLPALTDAELAAISVV